VAIHPLKHPEPRHSIGIAQPPAFCFVRLFAHAAKRVTFPGQHKYKKAFLHNAFRDRVASSTSTFFHDEPLKGIPDRHTIATRAHVRQIIAL
jgi:hypothetical protein